MMAIAGAARSWGWFHKLVLIQFTVKYKGNTLKSIIDIG
jgi:hypothetical protein